MTWIIFFQILPYFLWILTNFRPKLFIQSWEIIFWKFVQVGKWESFYINKIAEQASNSGLSWRCLVCYIEDQRCLFCWKSSETSAVYDICRVCLHFVETCGIKDSCNSRHLWIKTLASCHVSWSVIKSERPWTTKDEVVI